MTHVDPTFGEEI